MVSKMMSLSLTHLHFGFFFVNNVKLTFAAHDFAVRIALFD